MTAKVTSASCQSIDTRTTTMMKWEFDVRNAVHAPVDPAAFQLK